MALELKPTFTISQDGSRITVTDETGLYDVTTNPGGWGAPNPNLYESCLVCIVVRKPSTGDALLTATSPTLDYIYDDQATNDEEKTFEKLFSIDSTLQVALIRVPVSLDDANYVEGGAIADGDHYYYDGDIYLRTTGAGVLVEDLMTLLEDNALLKGLCDDLATPLLALKFQELYKEYTLKRKDQCDDAESLFNEIQKLNLDIQGLYYTFYSNLHVEAQNQIEDLLDKYAITENSI